METKTKQEDTGVRRWLFPRNPSKARVGLAVAFGLILATVVGGAIDKANAEPAPAAKVQTSVQKTGDDERIHVCSAEFPCSSGDWIKSWKNGNQGRTRGKIPERVARMAYRAWMGKWSKAAKDGDGLTWAQERRLARKDGAKAGPSFEDWCDRAAGYTFLCPQKETDPTEHCIMFVAYTCNPKDQMDQWVYINRNTDWGDVDRILTKCTRNTFIAGIGGGGAGGLLGMWFGGAAEGVICILDETDGKTKHTVDDVRQLALN